MSGPSWTGDHTVGDVARFGTGTLLATKGAIPITRDAGRTAIVSEAGKLGWLYDDGATVEIAIAEDILDSDEVHVGDFGVIGTTVRGARIAVTAQGWAPGPTVAATVDAELTWGSDAYCLVTADQLTVLEPTSGGLRASAYQILLPNLTPIWSAHLDLPSDFEAVSAHDGLVVARADDGVLGDRMRVLSHRRGALVEVASDHGSSAWHVRGGVFLVHRALDENAVAFVSQAGEVTRQPVDGAIGSVGGDRESFLATMFDGAAEFVAACEPSDGRIRMQRVSQSTGRKSIGRGVAAWLSRGVRSGLVYESADALRQFPAGTPSVRSVVHDVARHDNGATALRWQSVTERTAGVVVHLHGGPEAYETDELRMYGLAADALELGWEWRSLNYRGSRSGDSQVTSAAWRRWGLSFDEDLRWLLADLPPDRPVVLIGWSFGAALALAAARDLRPHGLVIGGAMGSLAAHRSAAIAVDPAHAEWFDRRFDVFGADGRYFDARRPSAPIRTRVLSFHGKDDEHCPYALFTPVRDGWTPMVTSWQHHDLAGGSHYPEQPEDAELVRSESRSLIQELGPARSAGS